MKEFGTNLLLKVQKVAVFTGAGQRNFGKEDYYFWRSPEMVLVKFSAPFTQDAEMLTMEQAKKRNTLLPIGVLTQHCNSHQRIHVQINANLLARVLCELGLTLTQCARFHICKTVS